MSKYSHFRTSFSVAKKAFTQTFPNHMAKGLLVLQHQSQQLDGMFLLHDARIPLSGYSDNVFNCLQGLPMLLVLNKADLVPRSHLEYSMEVLSRRLPDIPVVTAICDKQYKGFDKFAKHLLPAMLDTINMENVRQKRQENGEPFYVRLVVAGIPNAGKSSMINALRRINIGKGGGSPKGAAPGITRSVMNEIRVSRNPDVMLVDTPGILDPSIPDSEVGMRLALIGTIPDKRIGIELLADYLLFTLNRHRVFKYVKFLGMAEPTDDVNELLLAVAKRIGALMKGGRPDIHRSANWFVNYYRQDRLGRMILDIEPVEFERHILRKQTARLETARQQDLDYMAGLEWWQRAHRGEKVNIGQKAAGPQTNAAALPDDSHTASEGRPAQEAPA